MTSGLKKYLLLLKNLFLIDQYVFGTISGLSNFKLNLARCFPFASMMNYVHSFA